jgi:hypothetical protein
MAHGASPAQDAEVIEALELEIKNMKPTNTNERE